MPQTQHDPNSARAVSSRVDVQGVPVAVRSFGEGEPLILLQRFRGSMDHWDPVLVSELTRARRVIVFDSLGVGETGGVTADSVDAAAEFVAGVLRALDVYRADVLGWSLGGMTAQIFALKYPGLVRKLVLAATMPPAGAPEVTWNREWLRMASSPGGSDEAMLALFFANSDASRSAGSASIARLPHPAHEVSPASYAAQARALTRYAENEGGWYARLSEITAPTFVANGDRDGLFPAIASAVLARQIRGSGLAIYPDSGHAFLFQYPARFAADLLQFLANES